MYTYHFSAFALSLLEIQYTQNMYGIHYFRIEKLGLFYFILVLDFHFFSSFLHLLFPIIEYCVFSSTSFTSKIVVCIKLVVMTNMRSIHIRSSNNNKKYVEWSGADNRTKSKIIYKNNIFDVLNGMLKSRECGDREKQRSGDICMDDEFITLLFINRQTNNIFYATLQHTSTHKHTIN